MIEMAVRNVRIAILVPGGRVDAKPKSITQ